MKKIIVASLFMFVAVEGFSQVGIGIGSGGFGMGMRIPIHSKRQKAQSMENKVQQMRSDLNLDSAQVVQVRGLLVERERRQSKGQPMPREEFNKRMDEILTPQQKERFRELRQKKRQGRPQNNSSRPPQDSTKTKQPAKDADWDDVYN